MAEGDPDTPMQMSNADEDDDSASESGSGNEGGDAQIEWLATGRAKRSTAGNRLAALLQQEDPANEEDEIAVQMEEIFAEDENDEGFEGSDVDQSDVQMDSSSDEDDQGPEAGADDMEGENELQRAARAERLKKRKADNIIPKSLRHKVKVDPTAPRAPPPRPKKKSERASWIPTPEDAPTRASARSTTQQSKEQLHQQMIEREEKRLKQLKTMEAAAKRKEAAKPKALTQADRLAEAARVEKKNAKSLNRWEESEKAREEEQRAKLAALHNRTLDGPVITWWSGMGEWVDGQLKRVGKADVEKIEKPTKKRKVSEMEKDKPPTARKASITDQPQPGPSATPTPVITIKDDESKATPPVPMAQSFEAASERPALAKGPRVPQVKQESPHPNPGNEPVPVPKVLPQPPPPVPEPPTPLPLDGSAPLPGFLEGIHYYASLPDSAASPSSKVPSNNATQSDGPSQPSLHTPPVISSLTAVGQKPIPTTSNSTTIALEPQPTSSSNVLEPPRPPLIEKATHNVLILQNFNEDEIKKKDVQARIVFGRKIPLKPSSTYLPQFQPSIHESFSKRK